MTVTSDAKFEEKHISLKFLQELCVIKMKNNAKFEEELTCQFRIDMSNLTNFDKRTGNLKSLHFNGLLLTKVYNI